MQQNEFETLTGIYPSSNLYNVIEKEYMDGNWKDKQTFCAAYKENKDGLAQKIQSAANDAIRRTEEKHRKAMAENSDNVQKLNWKITHLKTLLDIKQEWKPADHIGTNHDQKLYEELAGEVSAGSNCCKELCDEAAKDTLSKLFGFMPESITIVREVCTYEVNRRGGFRVKDTFDRRPLYASTDWNYIRFDCTGLQWEMIDGELTRYED